MLIYPGRMLLYIWTQLVTWTQQNTLRFATILLKWKTGFTLEMFKIMLLGTKRRAHSNKNTKGNVFYQLMGDNKIRCLWHIDLSTFSLSLSSKTFGLLVKQKSYRKISKICKQFQVICKKSKNSLKIPQNL